MTSIVMTGVAGGMGTTICKELLAAGYLVIGIDLRSRRLDNLRHQINSDRLTCIEANLADNDLEKVVAPYFCKLRNLQGLVNLAGVSIGDDIEKLTINDWDLSFKINVTAAMRLSKLCIPFMKAARKGSIVNVSSPAGIVGARKPSYGASKAALIGLTMSLARNVGKYNIRVNAVLPGATITHMTNDWTKAKRTAITKGTFLGRLCSTKEVAKLVQFLLSDDSSYLTGSIIDATAGGIHGHSTRK